MTTVAFDGTTMAADSAVSGGGYYDFDMIKVKKHPSGYLLGGCGDIDMLQWFLDMFTPEIIHNRAKGHRLTLPTQGGSDFAAMVVSPSGKAYVISDKLLVTPIKTFGYMAVGSGSAVALGALAMGASASEAVKIAARHDQGTGGRIKSISLTTKRKKK